jgi:hypothetical protein
MVAIRATYDGKEFRALEPLPKVDREVPVVIIFLEETQPNRPPNFDRESQRKIIEEMRAARDAMEPLGCSVADLLREARGE